MATKSRRFTANPVIKAILWIVVALCCFVLCWGIANLAVTAQSQYLPFESLVQEDYADFRNEMSSSTDSELAAINRYWDDCRVYLVWQLAIMGGLALALVWAALWLTAVCGRKPNSPEVHLLPVDHLWSELLLGACGLSIFCVIGTAALFADTIYYSDVLTMTTVAFNSMFVGITLLLLLTLFFWLSLVRLLKARRMIKNSLTYKVLYWCTKPFTQLWRKLRDAVDLLEFKDYPLTEALQKRQIIFFSLLGGLMVLVLLLGWVPVLGAVVVVLSLGILGAAALWQMQNNRKTYLEINKGFSKSFEQQMKSERTKTALITNVSHDLKTPLTSIITYVELLSQEELPDTARDYVTVLGQKAERLKQIVADLMDLSKSVGGSIPLELEQLDLHRLLEQTVADMQDHIETSGLQLKTKLPEGEINVYSDGKKLYRVFQNLIDNTLKYSLEGSRVYLSLERQENQAVVVIKNTSASEITFTAEEILQRFHRGDQSRTGEGSGLGLSIAESFTQACGGKLTLDLDGDLFKVTVTMPVLDSQSATNEPAEPVPAAVPAELVTL
ncbi:MAG: HAMP domain-containing sensor histidine kinase [Angelakisella sp.]